MLSPTDGWKSCVDGPVVWQSTFVGVMRGWGEKLSSSKRFMIDRDQWMDPVIHWSLEISVLARGTYSSLIRCHMPGRPAGGFRDTIDP